VVLVQLYVLRCSPLVHSGLQQLNGAVLVSAQVTYLLPHQGCLQDTRSTPSMCCSRAVDVLMA
jgi:hypothetical protein